MPVALPLPCFHRCLGIAVAHFQTDGNKAFVASMPFANQKSHFSGCPVTIGSKCRSMQIDMYIGMRRDLLSHCCCPSILKAFPWTMRMPVGMLLPPGP